MKIMESSAKIFIWNYSVFTLHFFSFVSGKPQERTYQRNSLRRCDSRERERERRACPIKIAVMVMYKKYIVAFKMILCSLEFRREEERERVWIFAPGSGCHYCHPQKEFWKFRDGTVARAGLCTLCSSPRSFLARGNSFRTINRRSWQIAETRWAAPG